MTEKKKLVPKRRFKGFEGDWEEQKLGDLVEYIKGFAFKSKDYRKRGIRIIRVSDLARDSIKKTSDCVFIDLEAVDVYEKYQIKKNDIIITTVGSKSEMQESAVGRPIIISDSKQYLLNQNLVKIMTKKEFDSYYIYCQLKQPHYTNYIAMIERGNANQANISINDLWQFTLNVPKYSEQAQIGQFFKTLDDTITLHQHKLEKQKALKEAYLSEMFPAEGAKVPKRRFKGFTGDWVEKNIANISDVKTGYPFVSDIFDDSGENLVVTNSNIQQNSPIVDNSVGNRINVLDKVLLNSYRLNIGDILVTMDGTVGRTAKVIENKQILAQRVGRLISKTDSEFLYQLLNTGCFFQSMNTISHGGTIKHISLNEIKNYVTLIPSTQEEQQKIGQFFKSLDDAITIQQNKIEKLQRIKKAYLSELFV